MSHSVEEGVHAGDGRCVLIVHPHGNGTPRNPWPGVERVQSHRATDGAVRGGSRMGLMASKYCL